MLEILCEFPALGECVPEKLIHELVIRCESKDLSKLHLTISTVIHILHFCIIYNVLIMNLGPSKISIRESKNTVKSAISDLVSLTLKHPMEFLAWAINIQSSIKLSHYLLIPVTVERHDV